MTSEKSKWNARIMHLTSTTWRVYEDTFNQSKSTVNKSDVDIHRVHQEDAIVAKHATGFLLSYKTLRNTENLEKPKETMPVEM